MSQPPTDPTTSDAPAREWGHNLSASLHRLWEENRRRAQAERRPDDPEEVML